MPEYIREFKTVGLDDVSLVGGKNASLGEMIQALAKEGVRVPDGFVVTVAAFDRLLSDSNIKANLTKILAEVDPSCSDDLSSKGLQARSLVKEAGLPQEVAQEIREAYQKLELLCGAGVAVAVRSSATAEDLPDASFAGQQESF